MTINIRTDTVILWIAVIGIALTLLLGSRGDPPTPVPVTPTANCTHADHFLSPIWTDWRSFKWSFKRKCQPGEGR